MRFQCGLENYHEICKKILFLFYIFTVNGRIEDKYFEAPEAQIR